MSMKEVSESYILLAQCASILNSRIEGRLQHIQRHLAGETDLPNGCPSRASLAELEMKPIYDALDEVNYAAKQLRDAVWKVGG